MVKVNNNNKIISMLCFIIPIIGFLLVMQALKVMPFGDRTLIIDDMVEQYLPFHQTLRSVFLEDNNSIFFNWSRTMGGNYFGLFAFYVSSPFALVTLLFPTEQLPVVLEFIILIKIGLCGLTSSIYLKEHSFIKKNEILRIPFSLAYALMTYNIVYATSNTMWFEGVIFLPMVVLGIDKIFNGKKGVLYLISLTLLLFFNYYTGYMVGIFSLIYFVFRAFLTFENKTKLFSYIKKYVVLSLFAIGIACILLIPACMDLIDGKFIAKESFEINLTSEYTFGDIIIQIFTSKNLAHEDGMPPIYAGIIIPFSILAIYLYRNKISKFEKILVLIVFVLLLCCLCIPFLDKIWHCFQSPNGYNHRYAYIVSFIMIYMAYRFWSSLKLKNIKLITLVLTLLFLVDLGVSAYNIKKEMDTIYGYSYDKFTDNYDTIKESVEYIKEDESFYRIAKDFSLTLNDPMLFNYNGIACFSSTYNYYVNEMMKKLGFAQVDWINSDYGFTPVTSSILNLKYIVSNKARHYEDTYEKYYENEDLIIYKNSAALPIGFCVPVYAQKVMLEGSNVFENQNFLLSSLSGEECKYFNEIEYSEIKNNEKWEYIFTATSKNPVYFYLFLSDEGQDINNITVNEQSVFEYFTYQKTRILNLGQFEPGELVKISINTKHSLEYIEGRASVYELDTNVYKNAIEKLAQNPLNIIQHKNGTLVGEVTARDGQHLFMSVPFERGWRVFVDEEKVEPYRYSGTFMMIPLTEGTHQIYMYYMSPGVVCGSIISLISLVLALLYVKKT